MFYLEQIILKLVSRVVDTNSNETRAGTRMRAHGGQREAFLPIDTCFWDLVTLSWYHNPPETWTTTCISNLEMHVIQIQNLNTILISSLYSNFLFESTFSFIKNFKLLIEKQTSCFYTFLSDLHPRLKFLKKKRY